MFSLPSTGSGKETQLIRLDGKQFCLLAFEMLQRTLKTALAGSSGSGLESQLFGILRWEDCKVSLGCRVSSRAVRVLRHCLKIEGKSFSSLGAFPTLESSLSFFP